MCTYLIKEYGTKKARGVCNVSPRIKETVTLVQTYIVSLNQTYVNIFWAISDSKNQIVVGADALSILQKHHHSQTHYIYKT